MSNNPLATVAMVTFNSERYVGEAIESVLSQGYDNFELVISDDCSTDATWDIIKRYRDPRIRAERNSRNLGEYPNRNRALELARGEYLIYIDGDDLIYPHGLEFMVRMLDAFPDAAMALAEPWSEQFVYPALLTSRDFFILEYLGSGVIAINFAHLFFRTSVLRTVGGFNTRYRSGDAYIQYQIALYHPCLLINNGLAWWRRRHEQASAVLLRDGGVESWIETFARKSDFLRRPECPLTREEIAQALSILYGRYIRMAFYTLLRGRVSQSLRILTANCIPVDAWRYMFTPGRSKLFAEYSRDRLYGNWRASPFATHSYNQEK